jgi:hypothetical protein
MRKRVLINFSIIVIFALALTTCTPFSKPRTLDEIKSDLDCIVYTEGMKWQAVEEKFGKPDFSPIPAGAKLSQNTRIYKGKTLIFYTGLKKTIVDGKIRYEEIITRLEICE